MRIRSLAIAAALATALAFAAIAAAATNKLNGSVFGGGSISMQIKVNKDGEPTKMLGAEYSTTLVRCYDGIDFAPANIPVSGSFPAAKIKESNGDFVFKAKDPANPGDEIYGYVTKKGKKAEGAFDVYRTDEFGRSCSQDVENGGSYVAKK